MSSLTSNTAMYVLAMCTRQVDHYTSVIDSCVTMEQLSTATPWMCEGFKGLQSIVDNLPRRYKKLLLPTLKAAKGYIVNVNHSKALELLQSELEDFASREHTEAEITSKIGSLFEQMSATYPGSVRCKVTIERRKAAAEDPAKEPPSPKAPEPEAAPESSGGGQEEAERTAQP